MAETGNQRDLTKGEKTKYRLARAMKECMQTTPVENITVKQITEKCELTRQTFYRNFLDKYDLINWYFDKLLTKSFEHMGRGKTVYDALVKKFTYIQEEQTFFAAAFRYEFIAIATICRQTNSNKCMKERTLRLSFWQVKMGRNFSF